MPPFTDLTGLAGSASAIAAAMLLLPGMDRLAGMRRASLLGGVFALTLIPFGGMPLAAYLRGAVGDLSITTLILLWGAMMRPWYAAGVAGNRSILLVLIAFAALALYPLALGLGRYDTYRLGYGDPLFVGALLLLALFAWLRQYALIAICVSLAILAWAVGWYESDNLWDYLLDPFVAIYSIAAMVSYGVKKMQR